MTTQPLDAQSAALNAAQALLTAVGLTTDDLHRHSASQGHGPTLADYIDQQLSALRQRNPGTGGTYAAGLRLLADGDHAVCECDCPACDDPDGCPCACGCDVADGTHHGRPRDRAADRPHHDSCTGRGGSCASRWTGRGGLSLSAVPLADIEQCQHWARVRAFAVNRHRDRRRVERGRTPRGHDGRGAAENFVGAVRWLYECAIADGFATRNPAKERLRKPERLVREPRALSAPRAEEIYQTAITTGQDPDGDGLIVVYIAEMAARRGGVLNSRYGFVNGTDCTVKVKEKKGDGAEHIVPITPTLAAALHRHVRDRGPRRRAPADAPEAQRRAGIPHLTAIDPLLYREPVDEFDDDGFFVARTTRPVTRRSLDNLRDRVKRYLPWADDFFLRWHDFRHTTGTMIDRVAGHAVAERHLGHRPSDTTSIYTGATLTENAAAVAAIFGVDHPLTSAEPVRQIGPPGMSGDPTPYRPGLA